VGRTFSIYYALMDGGIAAGSWIWGTVAENHSLTWALEGSSGALLLVAASGVLFLLRERRESDPDPLEELDALAVALNLKPRSVSIVVKVEYLVAEENLEAFLDLMRARRHAQRPRSAVVAPAQYSGVYAMDRDIPFADLDRLTTPESSSHGSRQGTW
jgi:hypothetical protein